MRCLIFLFKKYLFPRATNLLSLALMVSIVGVVLGIIQLMLVLSVMSGFLNLFRENYTRISSDIVVIPRLSHSRPKGIQEVLEGTHGVQAITEFAIGQGMVIQKGVAGVTLEGIHLETSSRVTPWDRVWVRPPLRELQEKDPYWIWLGVQLAKKLKVKEGDSVDVLIADGSRTKRMPFRVTALTKFGIYDHDLHYARVDLNTLGRLHFRDEQEPMYKIKAADKVPIDSLADRLKEVLGPMAVVKKWSDVHQNIFLAVEHQKAMLFWVLEIVVGLAAVNVVNLLMISSYHRRRDVAILRAMGMRLRTVVVFFLVQGAMVGFVGILLGVAMGFGVCKLVEVYQPSLLSESIYNVTRLPFVTQPKDVVLISGAAFVLCVLFSLFPALRAATSRPVEALRYE